MKKILIIGSSGLLGKYLYSYLRKKKKIITKKFIRNSKRNFFSKKFCNDFFKENNFDIIIYLSAFTDIDKCQKNKKKAYKVNYVLLKNVVKYSSFYNKKTYFIFTSTDQFYDKYKSNNISKNKIYNYYAKTKLLSENLLIKKNSCILRTNFFGKSKTKNRNSFTDFIYKNLKLKKKIYLAHDWLFSPIYINNLCKVIYLLCKKNIVGKFNIGSKKGFSKYDFGIYFSNKLNLNLNLINKISYKNLKLKVKRPLDMRMQVGLLNKKLHLKITSLKQEINMALRDYK
jgi:dTDP-4-dehydrorhamnose reductase